MESDASYMVFFAFDKATLTDEARQTIGDAADAYRRTGAARLRVVGHTDTVGTSSYNMDLSQRRADAVARELERQGVPAQDIAMTGVGEQDLLVPTADGVRERQNRRVEIMMPAAPPPAPVAAAPAAPQPMPPEEPQGRYGFSLAPLYGHNFRETDEGDDGTENDLAGIELGFMALPGYLGGVSLKQGVLWSFNGEDDGLTGRTVASVDFAPDLGMFQPVFSINVGGVYGKGVQDGFVAGPEIGLGFNIAGLTLRPKIAYDYQFRNPNWDEGILWGGLDLGLRF
ncbi:OmpA family protein [Geminicoccaceae bacterium 1502E]|nr:OmpA family protein [Geminicoccaceae bacterium 1502E]